LKISYVKRPIGNADIVSSPPQLRSVERESHREKEVEQSDLYSTYPVAMMGELASK
jgi:hypothetical protein